MYSIKNIPYYILIYNLLIYYTLINIFILYIVLYSYNIYFLYILLLKNISLSHIYTLLVDIYIIIMIIL